MSSPNSIFPASAIRECRACGLRASCRAPVPGDGPQSADVMLIGEAPGYTEDRDGRPFVGAAGRYLDSLLSSVGLPRDKVYISNTVHCRPPNNRTPTVQEIATCSSWLDIELALVSPRIIVALGASAIRRLLGPSVGTVEHLHGRPIEVTLYTGRQAIVLPAYHPAAALHETTHLRQCQEDFQVLRGLVRGASVLDYGVRDEYPNPDYRVADTPELLSRAYSEIQEAGEYAVDTELCRGRLWSAQVSCRPGTGWFIPIPENLVGRFDLMHLSPATAILHNYLFDIQYVNVPDDGFVDTMQESYLLGLAQGLKELAYRLCGVAMINYSEVVRPGQHRIALDYLTEALTREWPSPSPIEETKWHNKRGELVTRLKKSWHISRKVSGILSDYQGDSSVDLFRRWNSIPAPERVAVESGLGPMPESSLMDIPFEQAIQYAVRDADATLRVHHRLRKLISDMGLDHVLGIDLGILPMVRSMMDTGMAVDVDHYRRLSEDYDVRMRVKSYELTAMVGHAFNPNSRLQVADVIYEQLGFTPTAKTPTGLVSTDDAELKKTGHPVAKGIIQYRGMQKLKSTYADNIILSARPDMENVLRLHTVLKTTRVETGRLSSSKDEDGTGANLQNIPIRNKESRAIKDGFVASPGRVMVEGDYCLAPGTRILTANYRWVPVEQLRIGDRLIGITENCIVGGNSGRNYKRVYTPTVVEAVGSRMAECWRVSLADGTILICSGGHPWLTRELTASGKIMQSNGKKTHSHSWGWVNTSDLVAGRQLSRLVRPWGAERSWEQGYLAGVFDGEGSISRGRGNILSFTQSDNVVLSTTMRLLADQGFKFHALYRKTGAFAGSHEVCSTWLCDSAEIVRFLGTNGPRRLIEMSQGMLDGKAPRTVPVDVVSVCPIGSVRVVSLQTNTHTFVAEGFFSHNSQIEMVTLAHLSRCKRLIELFLRGGDPHTEMAARIFGVPLDEAAKSKYRYPVKRLNFGIAYLIGAHGLANQIQEYIADLEMDGELVEIEPWDEPTCQKFIDDWYALNPEVKDFQLEMAAQARRYGYVSDIAGRIRYIPEVFCPIRSVQEAGLRQAANLPVTASAQEIIKSAMGRLWRELPSTPWADGARWLMQIHDSLVVEVVEDEDVVRPFLRWMSNIMTTTTTLLVPVKVDFKVGKRWGSLEKFSLK